ncbi:hypothetical protein BKA65DRAFT_556500 [Rhexocercosporidium sp. MPI-PUGE-AT-0058]|nr:hypothetical protein BKA65DRAFT_556500 [Rhexocercosporidium sp. MPI-PUGE-AT-0058]
MHVLLSFAPGFGLAAPVVYITIAPPQESVIATLTARQDAPPDFCKEVVTATQDGEVYRFVHHIDLTFSNDADNNEVVQVSEPLQEAVHNLVATAWMKPSLTWSRIQQVHWQTSFLPPGTSQFSDFIETISAAFELAYASFDSDRYFTWALIPNKRLSVGILGVLMILKIRNIDIQNRLILNRRLFREKPDDTRECDEEENEPVRVETNCHGEKGKCTVKVNEGWQCWQLVGEAEDYSFDPVHLKTQQEMFAAEAAKPAMGRPSCLGVTTRDSVTRDAGEKAIGEFCGAELPRILQNTRRNSTMILPTGYNLASHSAAFPTCWWKIAGGMAGTQSTAIPMLGTAGDRIEKLFNEGKDTAVLITASHYKEYTTSVADCISQLRLPLDNCDHGDANNPLDNKYGGVYANDQGVILMVTPWSVLQSFPPANIVDPECLTEGKGPSGDEMKKASDQYCVEGKDLYSFEYGGLQLSGELINNPENMYTTCRYTSEWHPGKIMKRDCAYAMQRCEAAVGKKVTYDYHCVRWFMKRPNDDRRVEFSGARVSEYE